MPFNPPKSPKSRVKKMAKEVDIEAFYAQLLAESTSSLEAQYDPATYRPFSVAVSDSGCEGPALFNYTDGVPGIDSTSGRCLAARRLNIGKQFAEPQDNDDSMTISNLSDHEDPLSDVHRGHVVFVPTPCPEPIGESPAPRAKPQTRRAGLHRSYSVREHGCTSKAHKRRSATIDEIGYPQKLFGTTQSKRGPSSVKSMFATSKVVDAHAYRASPRPSLDGPRRSLNASRSSRPRARSASSATTLFSLEPQEFGELRVHTSRLERVEKSGAMQKLKAKILSMTRRRTLMPDAPDIACEPARPALFTPDHTT